MNSASQGRSKPGNEVDSWSRLFPFKSPDVGISLLEKLANNRLLANLVEFPGVPKGRARFRFQMMSSHTLDNIRDAARIMAECRARADAEWREEGR